jgi:hypothetical protein
MLFRVRTNRAKTRAVFLVALALVVADCAKAPPSLSPVGVRAFHASRVVEVLDLVRDVAIAAEAVTPKLLSTDKTRLIVEWHRTTVASAGALVSGWQAGALAGLESWVGQLNDAELAVVRPYVILARAIIAEVP